MAYQQALKLDPEKIDAYLHLGDMFRSNQDYDKAVEWYRNAQEVDPRNYGPSYYLGLVARAQKRYEEALAYFDRSLTLDPGNAGVLYDKAITLDAWGRRGDATAVLAEAIANHKNSPQSWRSLLEQWQKYPTHEIDPDYWWALGREAEKTRDWQRAADLYQRGSELAQAPDDYRLLNRYDDAIRSLAEAITFHSNPPESWKNLLEKWQAKEN